MTAAQQDVTELEAPSVPAEDDEAPAGPREFEPSANDKAAIASDLKRMGEHLRKQKKVTVKVQEDTYVGLNGYGFLIKGKTKVQVPEQVADVLEEAGRI